MDSPKSEGSHGGARLARQQPPGPTVDGRVGVDPRRTLAVQTAKVRKLGFRMKRTSPSHPANKILPGSRTVRYHCHSLPIVLTALVVPVAVASVGFDTFTVAMHLCLSPIFAPMSAAMSPPHSTLLAREFR